MPAKFLGANLFKTNFTGNLRGIPSLAPIKHPKICFSYPAAKIAISSIFLSTHPTNSAIASPPKPAVGLYSDGFFKVPSAF